MRGMHALSRLQPLHSLVRLVCYTAVRIFFYHLLKSYFLSLPSNSSLYNKFTCNDWKFCTEKQNIKILLEPVHMLGNIKSSLN